MSDKLFYAVSGLIAVGLIALALVWPPRSATGLDDKRAAPTASPVAEAEAVPEAAAPVPDAEAEAAPDAPAPEPAGE